MRPCGPFLFPEIMSLWPCPYLDFSVCSHPVLLPSHSSGLLSQPLLGVLLQPHPPFQNSWVHVASKMRVRALSLVVATSTIALWLPDVSVGAWSSSAQGRESFFRTVALVLCIQALPAIAGLTTWSPHLCSRVHGRSPATVTNRCPIRGSS